MRTPNRADTSTPGRVKNEIDHTLEEARDILRRYVGGTDDLTPFRLFANSVHQVAGVLQMAELNSATQLAQEIESLASAVVSGRAGRNGELIAVKLLGEGLDRLSSYVERLANGLPDRPIDNVDMINALRRARCAEELDPYSLFHPDLGMYPPKDTATGQGGREDMEGGWYAERVRDLRRRFQAGLLKWLRDQRDEDAWESMAAVLTELYELSRFEASTQIWWVARAYLDVLKAIELGRDDPRKHTLASLDQLMRKLGEESEAAITREDCEMITRYMLYHIGRSSVRTDATCAVIRLFELDILLGAQVADTPTGTTQSRETGADDLEPPELRRPASTVGSQIGDNLEHAGSPDRAEAKEPEPATGDERDASSAPFSDHELIAIFTEEALSHIATIRGVMDEYRRLGEAAIGEELLQAVHTLQGKARSLHLVEMSEAYRALYRALHARKATDAGLGETEMGVLDALLISTAKVLDHLNRDKRFPEVIRQELVDLAQQIEESRSDRGPGVDPGTGSFLDLASEPIAGCGNGGGATAPPSGSLAAEIEEEAGSPNVFDELMEDDQRTGHEPTTARRHDTVEEQTGLATALTDPSLEESAREAPSGDEAEGGGPRSDAAARTAVILIPEEDTSSLQATEGGREAAAPEPTRNLVNAAAAAEVSMPDPGQADTHRSSERSAARIRSNVLDRLVNHAGEVPRVMVVDDSLTVRKVTARNLGRNGMEVVVARDGLDALDQLSRGKPDLVLVDIEMPRMDGYELTTRLRGDPNYRDIPIIAITSHAGAKHRERAMELGANSCLTKPYQEQELVDEVKALLGRGPKSTAD